MAFWSAKISIYLKARDKSQHLADELTVVRHKPSDANKPIAGLREEIVSHNEQLLEAQRHPDKEHQSPNALGSRSAK